MQFMLIIAMVLACGESGSIQTALSPTAGGMAHLNPLGKFGNLLEGTWSKKSLYDTLKYDRFGHQMYSYE